MARRLRGIGDIVGYHLRRWEEELGGAARYPTGRGAEVYFGALGLAELANTEIKKAPRGADEVEAARTAALGVTSRLLAFGRRVRADIDTAAHDGADTTQYQRNFQLLQGGVSDVA